MIPLRDTQPSQTRPVVTLILIAVNFAVFLLELAQGNGMDRFMWEWGLVPAKYTDARYGIYTDFIQQFGSLFTFMFLHGGWLHLVGNMWSLWIFGDNVEDRLGPVRFGIFYVLCGLASGLTHFLTNALSPVPVVGASGAIAGVMGAYFLLYPGSRILTLIPIFFFPLFIEIRAFLFFGIWFALQFLNAFGGATGIAWWAHIGGFLMGIFMVRLFVRVPEGDFSARIRESAKRKRTPKLQMVRPEGVADSPHMHGVLVVTPYEALAGCVKRVNIPWGMLSRMYTVQVPKRIREGQKLRLKGLGRKLADGSSGDLYLEVKIRALEPRSGWSWPGPV